MDQMQTVIFLLFIFAVIIIFGVLLARDGVKKSDDIHEEYEEEHTIITCPHCKKEIDLDEYFDDDGDDDDSDSSRSVDDDFIIKEIIGVTNYFP